MTELSVMLEEETAGWLRAEAARRGLSVSEYVGGVVEERRRRSEDYEDARRTFMGKEPRKLRGTDTPLPPRDEQHGRGVEFL